MEDFSDDRSELSGSLISMEFGPSGRISQLWAADPVLPEEGEEFQFILPPIPFGEETSEDLLPGTILLGVRTGPEDHWVFSRNSASNTSLPSEDEDTFSAIPLTFEYDFPLISDIQVTGKFYEQSGPIPQVVWEIEVRNRGKISVEIGELGFPLALNNFYDGFGWNDEQLKKLWNSRLYVHKYIGGAASYVYAQRMTSEPPGLLVCPGDDRGWEFCSSIPSSLTTPHQWEGIPVVYAYSRATVEREGWPRWWNDHTSLILEPGDRRTFKVLFVPTERDREDGVNLALTALGRPAIRVLPSAVAPADVGIAVEVQGAVPKRWFVSRDAEIQTDEDEEGGFCFVKPKEPGRARVTFEDSFGRHSHVHLMFTEPIDKLIKRRADYIVQNQVCRDESSPLNHAIVQIQTNSGEAYTNLDEYSKGTSGIECSVSDALFLAAKNSLYPSSEEIKILDAYVDEFLLKVVQNPGDMSVGSVLSENGRLASYFGRPMTYPPVFALHHTLYQIAKASGDTKHRPEKYLIRAAETALAMFQFGWRNYIHSVGILGYPRVYRILEDLTEEGMDDLFLKLEQHVTQKASEMVKLQYPYAGESVLDTSGFEAVYTAGLVLDDDEHMERTLRCSFAARSLAPSWWWYGSDKRSWDGTDITWKNALIDRGETCLGHTNIPNALSFFHGLDRDYLALPDVYMRIAFGGMLGPWALVRGDGAASMCYCPDPSSKHFGYNPYTGTSGIGYYHYIQEVGAYVLPVGKEGVFTFGCHFQSDENSYKVQPWDGVGRRVVLRQIGAEFEVSFGKILELELDIQKSWFKLTIENPADKSIAIQLTVRGLWGSTLDWGGNSVQAKEGEYKLSAVLPPSSVQTFVGGSI